MNADQTYSTRDLAKLLDVNVSTVKRWADSGQLRCAKTVGGHRRFLLRETVSFLKEQGLAASSLDPIINRIEKNEVRADVEAAILGKDWSRLQDYALKEAMNGNAAEIQQLFSAAMVAGWHPSELCDHIIGPTMAHVGQQWALNRLTVADEHLVTHTFMAAVLRLPIDWGNRNGKTLNALVGSFAPDLHELACACVAQVLAFEGWKVDVLGAATPSGAFVEAMERRSPDLVCVSATVIHDSLAFRNDCERLSLASVSVGNKYVIGGSAVPPGFFACPHRVATILQDMGGLVEYVRATFPGGVRTAN